MRYSKLYFEDSLRRFCKKKFEVEVMIRQSEIARAQYRLVLILSFYYSILLGKPAKKS